MGRVLGNVPAHGRDAHGRLRVEVGVRGTGHQVVITVDDQGPGVPPEARERIFERFQRGPDSTGSGRGLTLVAQQAALHRRSITVTDSPGGTGARFEVRLPWGTGSGDGSGSGSVGELPGRRDWLIGTAGAAGTVGTAWTNRSQSFPKDRRPGAGPTTTARARARRGTDARPADGRRAAALLVRLTTGCAGHARTAPKATPSGSASSTEPSGPASGYADMKKKVAAAESAVAAADRDAPGDDDR